MDAFVAPTFRSQLWAVMHHGRGKTGHGFQFFLVILIIISLAILPLELFAFQIPGLEQGLLLLEAVITAFFTIEYILRIYAAPNRMKYIFSFFGIIDILSILPFYIGLVGTQFLRALRFLRVIRLLRLSEINAAAIQEDPEVLERGVGHVDGEHVDMVVSRHPVYLMLGIFPSLIATSFGLGAIIVFPTNPIAITLGVTLFLFALFFLWRTWLNYGYDVLYITSHRLIYHDQHLFGRSINQVNYRTITNVKPSYPGPFAYVFRYGTLIIETAADQFGHFEFPMVKNHEKAARIIMKRCFGEERSQSQQQSPEPPSAFPGQ